MLTTRDLSAAATGLQCPLLNLDACTRTLAAELRSRPDLARDDAADQDPAAYVIYTSGSSGRPKGVEVAQSSICNFLDVVPSIYDVRPDDRVYQG